VGASKSAAFAAEGVPVASGKKKKARQNFLLICGPTNSGKTALFNHLLTKEVRTTVTSMEVNETPGPMEVKLPSSDVSKKLNIMDIPGHYHFRERLNEALNEQPRAILVVLDSKEKEKFGEAAEILYEILNNLTVLS
jgi:GTPase SAR1 family protein